MESGFDHIGGSLTNTCVQAPAAVTRSRNHADTKIEESGVTAQQIKDLVEANANFKVASVEVMNAFYPLLSRVQVILARNSNAPAECSRECDAALAKLDFLKGLVEGSRNTHTTPVKEVQEAKVESITESEEVLVKVLSNLKEFTENRLLRSKENLNAELQANKTFFDETTRLIQEPLRKVKAYLKLLRADIDYEKSHTVLDCSVSDISQVSVFSNKEFIDSRRHSIKCSIETVVKDVGSHVKEEIHQINATVADWEEKNDELNTLIVQIDYLSLRIDWKLHEIEFLNTLLVEMNRLLQTVAALEAAIKGVDSNLNLSQAEKQAKVTDLLDTYDTLTRPAIEEAHKNLMIQLHRLNKYMLVNLPQTCDVLMGKFHFYNKELEKSNKDKVNESFKLTHEEASQWVKVFQKDWNVEFRPYIATVVDLLNPLASGVFTKDGKIRTGIVYLAKSYVGANTIYAIYPNYKKAEKEAKEALGDK